jgi:hypothetical protein
MKVEKITTNALKAFTKNTELDKYSTEVLFKEKIKMANHILNTVGLPKT